MINEGELSEGVPGNPGARPYPEVLFCKPFFE